MHLHTNTRIKKSTRINKKKLYLFVVRGARPITHVVGAVRRPQLSPPKRTIFALKFLSSGKRCLQSVKVDTNTTMGASWVRCHPLINARRVERALATGQHMLLLPVRYVLLTYRTRGKNGDDRLCFFMYGNASEVAAQRRLRRNRRGDGDIISLFS